MSETKPEKSKNAIRQERHRAKLDAEIQAGRALFAIFDIHFKDFKKFLTTTEKSKMDELEGIFAHG